MTRIPPKNAPRTSSVAAAAQAATAGKVAVRAIEKGFYGRPIASIKHPGAMFYMAVRDLVPYAKGVYSDGTPIRFATVENEKYALPSWVELVTKAAPAAPDGDIEDIDEAPEESSDIGDDVL